MSREAELADQSLAKTGSAAVHVILPAYNEAAGLRKMFEQLPLHLGRLGLEYQITVVDDGSSDDTAEVVIDASAHLPVRLISHNRNQGLAAAMRTGLSAVAQQSAASDIIVTMDGDNTHPAGLISRMVQLILEGHDMVIASRFRPGARVVGLSRFRHLTGSGAAMLFKLLFPIRGVRDYTCGFRVFRCALLQQAFQTYGDDFISERGFTCTADLLLKMSRLDPIICEVPMILRYDWKVGASKMRVGATIAATFKLALKRRLGYFK